MSAKHSTIDSFGFAFQGIATSFKREPNFKIQIVLGTIAIIAGLILGLTQTQWLVLLLTISLVLMMEMINTVLEALINIVSPQIQQEAKVAKDVAAAAVLVASIFSIAIGTIIFLPKILTIIGII
jgi:diacylglycerol kinase